MSEALAVYGAKGGESNGHTPVEQDDSAQSLARCRMLVALGEGEFAGGLDATRIFLDSTPLGNADGTLNFDNITWDFRPGTQTQTAIAGFPAVENETSIGVEVTAATPFVRALSNTQIDAVTVRVGISALYYQEDDGDIVGSSVHYRIDVATDGGAYQTVVDKTVSEKLSSLYEISHRINLPTANTGWQIRLVRITPDSTSSRLQNRTSVQAITEVIDAKLRYPHTALLYVSFNAKSFSNIPKISCKPKGRVIRIPVNYDPVARTYTGTWDGTFKWAWSNNPAWVWFDILTEPRFGLGRRVTTAMLDKWELYRIAQRCDQRVPDGLGGAGTEPRFVFDCYIQAQEQAWTVVKDIAAGFSGLTFWGNNMFQAVSDMPVDTASVKIVTRASMIDKPNYPSGSYKDRISSMLVNYSDASNHYQDRTTATMLPDFVRQFGFRQSSLTAIGCTRESEAQRRGAWGIYTNYLDRQISFQVGLEGYVYLPGTVIYVADERVSGRVYGGRVVSYNSTLRAVTVDRGTSAVVGDTLMIRTLGGVTESRVITQVNGVQLIVASVFNAAPHPDAVFVIDAGQLRLQQFRVVDLTFNEEDNAYSVTGLEYNASKYDAVDNGAVLDTPVISLIPTGIVSQPRNITVSAFDWVRQNQRIASMVATWDVPITADGKPQADIIGYDMQWKRDDNNWINVPRTGLRSFQIDGIYEGDYLVRVRAVNSGGASSLWATSVLTHLTGRQGEVPAPLAFAATDDQVFAINLSWAFAPDTADTQFTEVQYSVNNSADNMQALAYVPYPQRTYQQGGLAAGVTFYYRARLVDRLGNVSAWTPIVMGQSSFDANAIIDVIDDAIRDSDAFKELSSEIDSKADKTALDEAVDNANTAIENAQNAAQQYADSAVAQEVIDRNAAIDVVDERVTSLTTKVNNNKASADQSLSALSTEQAAQATDITNLQTSLDGKADSSALSSLQSTVNQQGDKITSQGQSITSLQTTVAGKADSSAVSALNSKVTQQGDTISSQGTAITSLQNTVADKADASALQTLNNTVTQQGQTLTSQGSAITSLSNSLKDTNDAVATKADSSALTALSSTVTQQGNDITANANQITSLSAVVDNNSASFFQNIEATLNNALASSEVADRQQVALGNSRAEISEVRRTFADANQATAERIILLSASVDANTGLIQQVQTTTATAIDALAQQVNLVSVTVGQNTAAIQTKATTQFDSGGNGNATFSVNAGVTYNGTYYSAGMAIGVQTVSGVTKSYALFNADTFAIYNGTADNNALPFVITGGQVFIRDAFIADGAITNAKIGAFIQSTNYVAGTTGWRLDKSGTFEINGSVSGQGRRVLTATQDLIYDGNGTLRVRMGVW